MGLFGQLANLGHDRFQLPTVTVNDADGDGRTLPFVLIADLGNGGVEAGTQTLLQATHGAAPVLEGPGPGNHQFDGEQGNEQGWFGHGSIRRTVAGSLYYEQSGRRG